RVYELQAFGNLLLSNYNTGINNEFPNVRMINAPDDFRVIYNSDEMDLNELQAKNIRSVMKNHTTFDRLMEIARKVGLEVTKIKEKVLVILEKDVLLEDFERQIFDNKSYIHKKDLSIEIIQDYDFITFFSDENLYEEYYLEELYSAFRYTDVNFVTKDENHESHNYINVISDLTKTMIDVTAIRQISDLEAITKGYNLDSNEITKRNKKDNNSGNIKKELSVIIPIHNNGKYLEEKCFASLKRSSS